MNRDKIRALLEAGWTPRIKTVKDHTYITLRKGRKETSLGPYNEELWNQVKQHKQSTLTPEEVKKLKTLTDGNVLNELRNTIEGQTSRIANLEKEHQAFSPYREAIRLTIACGEWKGQTCRYRNAEGYCEQFVWDEKEPPYFKKVTLPYFKSPSIDYQSFVDPRTKTRYWRIRSQCWVCGLCGLYRSRNEGASYQKKQNDDLSNNS